MPATITRLELMNADTGTVIQPLTSGDALNLATLPTRRLNVRAITNPTTVKSVAFRLNNVLTTEFNAPYAMKGDASGVFNPWTPTVGLHNLVVTPTGTDNVVGTPLTVSFTVTDVAAPPTPTPIPTPVPPPPTPTPVPATARSAYYGTVMDFPNVDPTGATDSLAGIQAASEKLSLALSGIVAFPPGNFMISAPLKLGQDNNQDIILTGSGKASRLTGNFAGYVIDKSSTEQGGSQYLRNIKQLWINNEHPSGGAIKLHGTWPGKVSECLITANIGINTERNSGGVAISDCQLFGRAGFGGSSGGFGISVSGESTIYRCDAIGFYDAILAGGAGGSIIGCRAEINKGYGYKLGQYSDGSTAGGSGWLIAGCTSEGNRGGLYMRNVNACQINTFTVQALEAYPHGAIAGITIPDGQTEYCKFSNIISHGEFNSDGFVHGVSGHSIFIGLGNRALTMDSVLSYINAGNSKDWVLHEQDCTQFRACNQPAPQVARFSQKPGINGGGPCEGDLHTFTDSPTAVFGATISGGGANRVVGRYSSYSDIWTVVAKA